MPQNQEEGIHFCQFTLLKTTVIFCLNSLYQFFYIAFTVHFYLVFSNQQMHKHKLLYSFY